MMGDGVIDLPYIRGLVEKAGYTGCIEVEIFSAENWWKKAGRRGAAHLHRALPHRLLKPQNVTLMVPRQPRWRWSGPTLKM